MDLLQQAKQLEQTFEAKKNELRTLEIQQAMHKEQFARQKGTLAEKGITFNTGGELQAVYTERQQRLQELINNQLQATTPTVVAH